MNCNGVRVDWPAAIVLGGERILRGRLSRLCEMKVVVDSNYQLAPGSQCQLALMLPNQGGARKQHVVQGRCRVIETVLSEMRFRSGMEWLELEARGEELLWRHARRD